MIKFDLRYVGREGSILATMLVLTNGLSLLVPLLFHECADAGAYGVFQYTNVIVAFLGITSLLGMNNAIVVAAAKDQNHVLRKASRIRFKTSLLAGCPLLLAVGLVFRAIGGQYLDIARACFLLLPFFPILHSYMGTYAYLNGKKRFLDLAVVQVLYSLGNVALICALLGYFPDRVFLPAVGSLVFKGLIEFWLYCSLVREDRIGTEGEGDRSLLSYGYKMSLTVLIGQLQTRLDRFIIGSFYKFSELGSFGAGKAVLVPLREMLRLYPRLYIPKLAQRDRRQALRTTYKALWFGLLGAVPVFAFLVIAVPWAYDLLLSRFEGSGVYARYFVIVVFLGVPFYFFYGFFQSQIMARREFVVRLANLAVLVVAMIALIPRFGLMGVIYAHMLAAATLSVHSWVLARRSGYSNGKLH